jgi:6,7-dimethyl-8-ribityllumazine synthase
MSGTADSISVDGRGLRVAIARSTFNESVTSGLLSGALDAIDAAGATADVFDTAGAFELPLVAQRLAAAGFDAVVALGAVILGETDHYDHVAHRASEGLMRVSLDTGVPIAFGILTVREERHALDRAVAGPLNKGAEAANAAMRTAGLLRRIDGGDGDAAVPES